MSSELFSPKTVARAIGVSESSLKRWCDSGKITAMKTAGGHRRLTHSNIISFLRDNNLALRHPEAVGLSKIDSQIVANTERAQEQLLLLLSNNEEAACRDLLVSLFISQWPTQKIIDEVLSPVFHRIGELWKQGRLDIYQERRACQICYGALHELRSILPTPATSAAKAIGASIEGDQYTLPTFAVELVLIEQGWNARALGSNLPFSSFREAIKIEDPTLVWVSVSHINNQSKLLQDLNSFAASLPSKVTLVIGGSAITQSFRNNLKSVICCDNMSQLIAVSDGLNRVNHVKNFDSDNRSEKHRV